MVGTISADRAFEVTLACTFAGETIEIPGGATRVIYRDVTVVYESLPIDADCLLTESDTGGADQVQITGGEGEESNQVTVGGEAALVVTNTFDDDQLPWTGFDLSRTAFLATLLLLLGIALVGVRRRRVVA